jgi:hypothetical protein
VFIPKKIEDNERDLMRRVCGVGQKCRKSVWVALLLAKKIPECFRQ